MEATSADAPKIIVLSRNYSTGLGLIRSLGEAGYKVDLVASARRRNSSRIASSSRYVADSREFLKDVIYEDKGEDICSYLVSAKDTYPEGTVLFPADDYTTSVLDRNRDSLKDHYLMPKTGTDREGDILKLMSKDVQGKIALESGLLRPWETAVDLNDWAIPEDTPYPCFVKPLKSIDGEKQEMAVCGSRDELKDTLERMKHSFSLRKVMVQEFLNIDKEYDVGGVCLGDRVIIPAVIEKTRIAEHERGVTMTGRMVPEDVLGDTLPKLLDMLKKIDYYGMFDLEFNRCGDRLYFNEINLRSGGPHFSYFLNGVNLPEIFAKGISGEDISGLNTVIDPYGKSFVYEKVAWEDHINGFMSKKELDEVIGNADFTLLANDSDPEPGKIFAKKIRLSLLKHRAIGAIKR